MIVFRIEVLLEMGASRRVMLDAGMIRPSATPITSSARETRTRTEPAERDAPRHLHSSLSSSPPYPSLCQLHTHDWDPRPRPPRLNLHLPMRICRLNFTLIRVPSPRAVQGLLIVPVYSRVASVLIGAEESLLAVREGAGKGLPAGICTRSVAASLE